MCTFHAESCVLVCHACHACDAAAPPQPMRDGRLPDPVVWEGWVMMHRQPCPHAVRGVLTHDGDCAMPAGTATPAVYVARR